MTGMTIIKVIVLITVGVIGFLTYLPPSKLAGETTVGDTVKAAAAAVGLPLVLALAIALASP